MPIDQKSNEITKIWNKNFICIMVINTLQCFAHFAGNPHVASYTKYLGANDQLTGLLAGMFFGIAFAIRPLTGPMVTKLDKKLLLIFTFICGLVANLGYALFKDITAFAIFRFISGLEYSFLGVLIMTLASDNLPLEKMGSGMGIYSIGVAVATAAAPAIGTVLLQWGAGLREEGFGFTLLFLFGAVMHALAIIPTTMLSSGRRIKEETADMGAWYKNILSVHAIPIAVILVLTQAAYSLYTTYMIEFGKERGIAGISVFFTVLALVLIITKPASGALTDRFGAQSVIIPGLVIFALSYIIIGSSTVLYMILIGAVIAAVGLGSSQAPLMAMGMRTAEPTKRGVVSNTIYLGIDLGYFLGPLLGGFLRKGFDYATIYKTAVVPIGLGLIIFIITLPKYKRSLADIER